jgi:transcriptional regulator with XRE-family HTH domain
MQWSEDQVDELYEAIGDRIKAARALAKVTQTDLGRRIGLTRSSIANIEAGRQRVMLHWVFQIAEELGVEPRELIVEPRVPTMRPLNELDPIEFDGQPDTTPDFVSAALRRVVSK